MKPPQSWRRGVGILLFVQGFVLTHAAYAAAELVVRRANVITVNTNQPRAPAYAHPGPKYPEAYWIKMNACLRVICRMTLVWACSFHVASANFSNSIRAFLQQFIDAEKINAGVVVGLVDARGSVI